MIAKMTVTVSTKPKAKDLGMHHTSAEYRAYVGNKTHLTIDFSELTEEEVYQWACKPIVIDFQGLARDGGVDTVHALPEKMTIKAPKPGDAVRLSPYTRGIQEWVDKGLTEDEAKLVVSGKATTADLLKFTQKLAKPKKAGK